MISGICTEVITCLLQRSAAAGRMNNQMHSGVLVQVLQDDECWNASFPGNPRAEKKRDPVRCIGVNSRRRRPGCRRGDGGGVVRDERGCLVRVEFASRFRLSCYSDPPDVEVKAACHGPTRCVAAHHRCRVVWTGVAFAFTKIGENECSLRL